MASLALYTERLGKPLAAHLLRRATYNVTAERIEKFADYTPKQAVNNLFTKVDLKFPNGPLAWVDGSRPLFDLGDKKKGEYFENEELKTFDKETKHPEDFSSHAWRIIENIADTSVKWKIINWFSSIFTIGGESIQNHDSYFYWRLLEKMALGGNIKLLALKVTVDNRMLSYLTNKSNTKTAPNENYAREFLELFTILKGEAKGVGDYTNYTEEDIGEVAKVLTGFTLGNIKDETTGVCRGRLIFNRHDTSNKTFSSAFNNKTIRGASNAADAWRELSEFVDMIFEQGATAKSYVRRMYVYFVSDKITPEIETDIISPLAKQLLNNGYEHVPILKELLMSKHFYDKDDNNTTNEIIGGKIKSPYELIFQTINLFQLSNSSIANKDYAALFQKTLFQRFNAHFNPYGMNIRIPPTVENWPGFFKSPNYSKNWFSNNTMYDRLTIGETVLRGKILTTNSNFPYKGDIVEWVKKNIDNSNGTPGTFVGGTLNAIGASNYRRVVKIMVESLLPTVSLYYSDENPAAFTLQTNERLKYFEDSLLGGLSPINWYFSWADYISGEMDDSDIRVGLNRLVRAITSSLEFQTF